MCFLYSLALALWGLVSAPVWLIQGLRHGKYLGSLRERLGRVPARLQMRADQPVIWAHAVSVGEVLAISGLVQELRERSPEARVVISTVTETGQLLARKRFGEQNVFYFPLDFGFSIRPYLRLLQPQLVVIAETEFWPNFLRLARESGARIAVVNARISDRSFPGYRRVRRWLQRVLMNVDLLAAQTEEDRRRLVAIGAPADRVTVSGNLKFDIPAPEPPPLVGDLRSALQMADAGPVLVAGSTMSGEEPLLLRCFELVLARYPNAVLILAPRHPERFEKVAELVGSLGLRLWRRSEWKSSQPIAGGVFLLDSIGELAAMYSLASLGFIGGSLVEYGGHNILEAAQHGVAILVGPHTENFRDMVDQFCVADAIRVVGPAELPLTILHLLENEGERQELARRALETLRSQTGATRRTLAALEPLLPKSTKARIEGLAGDVTSYVSTETFGGGRGQ